MIQSISSFYYGNKQSFRLLNSEIGNDQKVYNTNKYSGEFSSP